MGGMNVVKFASWVAGLLASVAVPLAALAAEAKPKSSALECPPADSGWAWWAILCTLVALGGVCVVAFRNANRTA
jgi:invasion protein IalB